jgi:hypothetical protein
MSKPTYNDLTTGGYNSIANEVELVAALLSGTYPDGVTPLSVNVSVVGAVGTQQTPTITTAAGSGTVAAGKRRIEFIFSSDFAGTVLGATFSGSRNLTLDFPLLPPGDSYAAVAYTVTAGSVLIVSY